MSTMIEDAELIQWATSRADDLESGMRRTLSPDAEAAKFRAVVDRLTGAKGEGAEGVTELISGAINETRELVAALPEELFELRKLCREQKAQLDALRAEKARREPKEVAKELPPEHGIYDVWRKPKEGYEDMWETVFYDADDKNVMAGEWYGDIRDLCSHWMYRPAALPPAASGE